MKTLAVTYTYHEHLSSSDALEGVACFEVEDDVAADMLEVEKPFGTSITRFRICLRGIPTTSRANAIFS